MSVVSIKRICIIGVGLIGGSFALGLKKSGFTAHFVGCGRNLDNLQKAKELGVIDSFQQNPEDAVKGADVVMLAVPMCAMKGVMQCIAPHLESHAIVTDAGSVKGSFVKDARETELDLSKVVPAHPIAGTEKSGAEAAFATLYENRKVILTPLEETSRQAIDVVAGLWALTGADVEELGVEHHDRVLAATSHLPHVLAFGIVDTLATLQESEEIFRYAAGGFHDFTRIASGDPVMWRDICLTNHAALLQVFDHLLDNLHEIREMIASGDSKAVEDLFVRAKNARDAHVQWSRKA